MAKGSGGGGSGPTVAKAYVAIIPTTKDAQKNISKSLIPELDSAGKEGGEKLSGGIGASLKSGASRIAGIAKAAIAGAGIAAVTKFVHDSVGAFSQFEQLSGGVQKIFNEIDTSAIISDAQNAYKELGISANQYLESMTSVGATFAATLGDAKGYDVAKEGLKAISDFASGTGRSVDLLTEKYALITRATSSYQSIADQFSGILPATSDEFLRQAQEAGLLGASYQKLTDVPLPEYQEALTKMLTRGVDSMGLLGNSASEAYTTLEGSTNMMKAAWQNLLVAFGSGDQSELQSALHGMTESVSAWARNLIPRLGIIFSSIVESLPTLASEIVAGLPGFVSSITDAIVSQLAQSELGSQVMRIISSAFGDVDMAAAFQSVQGAITTALGVIQQAFQIVQQVVMSVISSIDTATIISVMATIRDIGERIVGILMSIGSTVAEVIVGLLWPTIQMVWAFIAEHVLPGVMALWQTIQPGVMMVIDMLAQVYNWISRLVSSLVEFLVPAFELIITTAGPVFDAIIAALSEVLSSVISVVGGIWDKIRPFIERLVADFSGFFSELGKWLNAVMPVVSEVAKWIGDTIGMLVRWLGDTVGGLIRGIGDIISGIIGVITGIVQTIYDLLTGNFDAVLGDVWGLISSIGQAFWGVVEIITAPFRSAFNAIKRLWNSTIGKMRFTVPDWVPGIGGASFGMPKLASGGTLLSGGTVMVGEAGPEILTLPRGARVAPLSASDATAGGTTYSVQVGNVDLSDDDQVRRVTREYLEFLARIATPGGIAMA